MFEPLLELAIMIAKGELLIIPAIVLMGALLACWQFLRGRRWAGFAAGALVALVCVIILSVANTTVVRSMAGLLVADCDRRAAMGWDPDKPAYAVGVAEKDVMSNLAAAETSCRSAVATSPAIPRHYANLARVLSLNKQPVAAREYWIKAAEGGHTLGQYMAGEYYKRGDAGLIPNSVTAFDWYSRAADRGYAPALRELGLAYRQRGEPGRAYHYLMRATDRCDWRAGLVLADIHQKGDGVQADPDVAKLWQTRANEFRSGKCPDRPSR